MVLFEYLLENGEDAVKSLTAEESLTLDYKADFAEKNKEFAKDVSAFANSAGGLIIYGVAEKDGRPFKFPGVEYSHDLLIGKEQIIETGVTPPLHIKIESIRAANNPNRGFVLVDIPLSLERPHMVAIGGENRYYHRHDRRSVPMNEYEIGMAYEDRRSSFEETERVFNEIQTEFRELEPRFFYLVGCPVPPKKTIFKITRLDKTQGIQKMAHLLGGGRGDIFSNYIEYSINNYKYLRFYDSGSVALLDCFKFNGFDNFELTLENIETRVNTFLGSYFDLFKEIGLVKTPVCFYMGTFGYKGAPLYKSTDDLKRRIEKANGIRILNSDLKTQEKIYLTELDYRFDSFLQNLLEPFAREFGVY